MHTVNNLGDITSRIRHELRGLPDIQVTRDNLRQVVTEVQREIVEEHAYPFMEEVRQFVMLPDFTLVNTGNVLTSQIALLEDPPGTSTKGTFVLVRAQLAGILGLGGSLTEVPGEYLVRLNGATLGLLDPSKSSTSANWQLGPFEIQTAEMPSPTGLFISVDDRANIRALTSTEGDLVVRFPRFLLDSDVAEVLSVRERRDTAEPLRPVDSNYGMRLSERTVGTPAVYWHDRGLRPTFGDLGINGGAFAPGGAARNALAILGREVPTPVRSDAPQTKDTPGGFTLSYESGGSLPAGKYTVFFSWMVAGRLSPPTQPSSVQVPNNTSRLRVTGAPTRPTLWNGWRLTMWVSYQDEAFRMVDYSVPLDTSSKAPNTPGWPVSVTHGDPIVAENISTIRWDDVYSGPHHRYIGMWPRPEKVTPFEMTVLKRPRSLIEPTDATSLPIEFNDLIVWEAAARIAAVQNGDAATALECRRLANRRLAALKSKFGMERDVRRQRSGVDQQSVTDYAQAYSGFPTISQE